MPITFPTIQIVDKKTIRGTEGLKMEFHETDTVETHAKEASFVFNQMSRTFSLFKHFGHAKYLFSPLVTPILNSTLWFLGVLRGEGLVGGIP